MVIQLVLAPMANTTIHFGLSRKAKTKMLVLAVITIGPVGIQAIAGIIHTVSRLPIQAVT